MADNHNNDNLIDLEKLKKDPNLWSRLSVLKGDDDKMEHIFEGEENPFLKDGPAAMEKINRLAEQGKLFVRGYGRASHYQKIEKKGDELKMEEGQYVLKRGAGWDPVGWLLSYLTGSYFRWLGIGFVAKWIDKRRKNRGIEADEKNRERDKYKELSRKEKKELKKALKKEKVLEKARKKLEKLEQETQNARKELDQLQGKDTGKNLGEMKSPLSQPPVTEQDKTSMQPTALGDQPPNSQNQLENQKGKEFVQQRATEYQFQGTQKTEKTQEQNQPQTQPQTRETGLDNMDDVPEEVRKAAQIVENFLKGRKVKQEPYQIAQEMTIEYAGRLPVEEEKKTEEQPQQTEVQQTEVQQPEVQPQPTETVNTVENEEIAAPRQDSDLPKTDMDSPINNPPDLEKDKVSAQERSKDQADLYDRLAAEKQAMDAVKNWQDRVVDSLFSHEEGQTMKEYYNMIKGNKEVGDEFLAGAVCGMLAKNATGPERNQQVMDDLLDGKSLGSQNENLISDGIAAYNDAIEKKTNGNSKPLENLLANSIRDLSRQASRETTLSPRLAMIGRMINNAVKIADDNGLRLPLDKQDWSVARGAATLATLSQKYHSARQYLGQEPMDISSSKGRRAVGDLLAGSAVEKMLQQDKRRGQTITNTQMIMGDGMWTMDNLRVFTKGSPTRRGITQEQVKTLMEKPKGLKALVIAKNVADDIVSASMEVQEEIEKARQKELEVDQEKLPEINPMQSLL